MIAEDCECGHSLDDHENEGVCLVCSCPFFEEVE